MGGPRALKLNHTQVKPVSVKEENNFVKLKKVVLFIFIFQEEKKKPAKITFPCKIQLFLDERSSLAKDPKITNQNRNCQNMER